MKCNFYPKKVSLPHTFFSGPGLQRRNPWNLSGQTPAPQTQPYSWLAWKFASELKFLFYSLLKTQLVCYFRSFLGTYSLDKIYSSRVSMSFFLLAGLPKFSVAKKTISCLYLHNLLKTENLNIFHSRTYAGPNTSHNSLTFSGSISPRFLYSSKFS